MAELNIDVSIKKYYCILFFPIGRYTRVGDIARVTIFGLPVYQRVGDSEKILWWVTKKENNDGINC